MSINTWITKDRETIEFVMANFKIINPTGIHNELLEKIKTAYKHGPRGIYESEEHFTYAMQFLKTTINGEFIKKSNETNEITSGNINDRLPL